MDRLWISTLSVLLAATLASQIADPDAIKRRALALAQAGDYVQARAILERLLSERPDDLHTRKLLARVLIAAISATAVSLT